ncbi:MAG: integrase [Clostridiales bacterium]|nr:integrase [Clostridiales bacterium]
MSKKISKDYFSERNYKTVQSLNKIIFEDLPSFAAEFFIGIENRTTPLTRLNYAYDLRIFFDFMIKEIPAYMHYSSVKQITLSDIDKLTTREIENFLNYLSFYIPPKREDNDILKNSERGKARKLSSVRAFFKYFFKKDKISSNIAANVDTPKLHEKEIIRLENDEVGKLLNLVENGRMATRQQNAFKKKTQLRDFAMLSLFLGTGIRISECVGLNIDDIDLKNCSFVVTRKGGNRVVLYFSEEVASALCEYMEHRVSDESIPSGERALFLSLQKRRITVRAVENLVKKYSLQVTPLKKITPHKLRSTFGTELYRATGDIYVVADVLGHKDVNTTKKHYAAISDDIRREASLKVKLHKDDND